MEYIHGNLQTEMPSQGFSIKKVETKSKGMEKRNHFPCKL